MTYLSIARCGGEHLQHLDQVLKILQEQRFYTKMSKCKFGMTEIMYLGHMINSEGVRVDEHKIAAIQDWSVPTTIT